MGTGASIKYRIVTASLTKNMLQIIPPKSCIDMTGDLSDEKYLAEKVSILMSRYEMIAKGRYMSTITDDLAEAIRHEDEERRKIPRKEIKDLSYDDVADYLHQLKMEDFERAFRENAVDGACLEFCGSAEEVAALGISIMVKAKMFHNSLVGYQSAHGIPLSVLEEGASLRQADIEEQKKLEGQQENETEAALAAEVQRIADLDLSPWRCIMCCRGYKDFSTSSYKEFVRFECSEDCGCAKPCSVLCLECYINPYANNLCCRSCSNNMEFIIFKKNAPIHDCYEGTYCRKCKVRYGNTDKLVFSCYYCTSSYCRACGMTKIRENGGGVKPYCDLIPLNCSRNNQLH